MEKIIDISHSFNVEFKIFFKTVKISVLLLIFGLSASYASSAYAQNQTINLNIKDQTIKEVFHEIEKNSEFIFFYNDNAIDINKRINISAQNASVAAVLDEILKDSGTGYRIDDRQIILFRISKAVEPATKEDAIIQGKRVSGTVKDVDGYPMPGVNVIEVGTSNGTVTDSDGRYSITLLSQDAELRFSFIGYKTDNVKIGDRTVVDFTMEENISEIDEVIVVGYGTMRKSDLTGAVASVKQKDLPPAANTSIAHMLTGKAAGLTALQTSAQPGGEVNMQIRGAASNRAPLIIIDGFPQTGFSQPEGGYSYQGNIGKLETGLNSINPNDIESIEILKDASATSIYGARAAGGVILVTTKRGKEGEAQVNYKGSFSLQKMYGLPTMLGPKDFMIETNETLKETWMRKAGVYPYGTKTYEQAMAEAEAAGTSTWNPKYSDSEINNPPAGTNWLDEITRNGTVQEHNLSVMGGTEKTKYLASLGYYDQKGIVNTHNLRRFTARINLDQKFSEIFSGGISASISQNKSDNVPLSSRESENAGVIRSALQFNPLIEVKDAQGNYNLDPGQAFLANPVSLLEIKDQTITERLMLLAYVEAKPIKSLTLRAQFGVDRNQGKRDYYMPTSVLFGKREGGYASKNQTYKTDYNMNFIANWNKTFGVHDIAVTAGYDYQEFTWDGFNAYNSKYLYDGALWNNLGAGAREKPGVGSYGGKSNLSSVISRVNYVLMNKYLLTVNFRADGSSNFSENHRWGYFPGVSVGWKIHEENFMNSTSNWLSELKLRVGYGQTGNDNLTGLYTYYAAGSNYILGGVQNSGVYLAALGNKDLKWETQTDINIGLDFGFLNHRFAGTLELFNRKITDILGERSLMSYQKITKLNANLDAEKQSRGIEFNFSSRNITGYDFRWTTDLTMTYYRDRWKKRDSNWVPNIYTAPNAYFEELWYHQSDEIVSMDDTEYIQKYGAIPGTVKILDTNGYLKDADGKNIVDENGRPQYSGQPDGKVDDADRVKVGVNIPVTVGLNNNFTYKNFDLNIYFYGIFNRWKVNDTKNVYQTESYRLMNGANMYEAVKDRWSYKNMDSDIPSIFQVNSSYGVGDYFLEKAWFIRCRNITLGYTFDQPWVKSMIKSARVFLDLQNPFVITPYTGTDPETDSMAGYPNQRTFTVGIDIKF